MTAIKQLNMESIKTKQKEALLTNGAQVTGKCIWCSNEFLYTSNGSGKPRDTCNNCREIDRADEALRRKLTITNVNRFKTKGRKANSALVKSVCLYCSGTICDSSKHEYCCRKHRILHHMALGKGTSGIVREATLNDTKILSLTPDNATSVLRVAAEIKPQSDPVKKETAVVAKPESAPDTKTQIWTNPSWAVEAKTRYDHKEKDRVIRRIKKVCVHTNEDGTQCGKTFYLPDHPSARNILVCREHHPIYAGKEATYPTIIKCSHCNGEVVRKSGNQSFCSDECVVLDRTITCKRCGKSYVLKTKDPKKNTGNCPKCDRKIAKATKERVTTRIAPRPTGTETIGFISIQASDLIMMVDGTPAVILDKLASLDQNEQFKLVLAKIRK